MNNKDKEKVYDEVAAHHLCQVKVLELEVDAMKASDEDEELNK